MKYLGHIMLVLCSIIAIQNSSAQLLVNEDNLLKINYTYENTLRFQWKIGIDRGLKKYNSITNTKELVGIILNNVEEIKAEASVPLDINIFNYGSITKVEIHKSTRPVIYNYKDSLLLFTGLHVINYSKIGQSTIQVYFDNPEDLKELSNINFDSIFSKITDDINKKKVIKKDSVKITELMFTEFNKKIQYAGTIGNSYMHKYTTDVIVGSVFNSDGSLGMSLPLSLSRHNYQFDQTGKTKLISVLSFDFGSTYQQDFRTESYGVSFKGNLSFFGNTNSISLFGLGVGIINIDDKVEDKSNSGIYFSWIAERSGFFLSTNFNLKFKRKEPGFWNPYTLNFGYKF